MARHDDLMAFIDQMAAEFSDFNVVALNQRRSDPIVVPIGEIVVDTSDNEICLVCATSAETSDTMNLGVLHENLLATLQSHPDYSLMVSEWFNIDETYTGRADLPLRTVEVNEDAKQFLLLY